MDPNPDPGDLKLRDLEHCRFVRPLDQNEEYLLTTQNFSFLFNVNMF